MPLSQVAAAPNFLGFIDPTGAAPAPAAAPAVGAAAPAPVSAGAVQRIH